MMKGQQEVEKMLKIGQNHKIKKERKNMKKIIILMISMLGIENMMHAASAQAGITVSVVNKTNEFVTVGADYHNSRRKITRRSEDPVEAIERLAAARRFADLRPNSSETLPLAVIAEQYRHAEKYPKGVPVIIDTLDAWVRDNQGFTVTGTRTKLYLLSDAEQSLLQQGKAAIVVTSVNGSLVIKIQAEAEGKQAKDVSTTARTAGSGEEVPTAPGGPKSMPAGSTSTTN